MFGFDYKKITKDIALLALVKAAATILGSLIAAFFAGNYISSLFADLQSYKFLIVGLIFLIILGVMYMVLKSSDSQPEHPPVQSEFKIISRNISYNWISDNEVKYTRKFKLKAKRDGLDRYSIRWNWTGDGDFLICSKIKSHTLIHHEMITVWNVFDVHFNRSLNTSDEIEIDIEWHITNMQKKPSPFCSATISEPTDELTFSLNFPQKNSVDGVVLEHMHSMSSREVIETTDHTQKNWPIDITIKKPKLLHHYQVRWTWN
jgi:hypothetical protein